MALFRGIQEYISLDANNITLVFDSGNIVNISGNIFLYPPQGHPILYKYSATLIDNIFTNDLITDKLSGLIINDVSDHLPVFSIIKNNIDHGLVRLQQFHFGPICADLVQFDFV